MDAYTRGDVLPQPKMGAPPAGRLLGNILRVANSSRWGPELGNILLTSCATPNLRTVLQPPLMLRRASSGAGVVCLAHLRRRANSTGIARLRVTLRSTPGVQTPSIPVLHSGAQLRYSIPVLSSGAARSSTEAFCGGEIYTAGMLHAFTEWRRSEPYVRNVKQAKKREARPPHRSCGPPPSPRRPCPSRYRSVFSRWAYDSPRSARPCAQSLRACFPRCA